MSIETEFQSTIENVQNAYKGLANLGATIPQNKNIENISDCLDEIYDTLPKTSFQEGTSVTLEGLKGKIDFDSDNGKKVVGKGDTEQNGEPSPTNEVPIQCVTGNQSIVESGKNLYNDNAEVEAYYYNASGVKTASPSASETYINQEYNLGNTSITISRDSRVGGASIRICEYNGDTFIKRTLVDATPSTTALDSNTTKVIFSINKSESAYFTNLQIEKGTTATTYEPYHTPITYPISLGNNKFYKIGDYADELLYDVDEDKVYKNEKIGKYVCASDEGWNSHNFGTNSWQRSIDILQPIVDSKVLILTTKFKGIAKDNRNTQNPVIYQSSVGTYQTTFVIRNTPWTSLEQVQAGMSSQPVYLVRETPQEIPITDQTLINQVKALYNAQSINGTTIIESNGDLPMIIKVRALKGE